MSLQYLTLLALLITVAQAYLTVNKLWIRKHEPAVAESVSIMGETLGLAPTAILAVNFTVHGSWKNDGRPGLDGGGPGHAPDRHGTVGRGQAPPKLVDLDPSGPLRGERRGRRPRPELSPALRGPTDSPDPRAGGFDRPGSGRAEQSFIEAFAESWGLRFSWDELRGEVEGGQLDFVTLRRALEEYLHLSPPPAQASQLGDVLGALVAIDEQTTGQEELILAQLQGCLRDT